MQGDAAGTALRLEESLRFLREHPTPGAAYLTRFMHFWRLASLQLSGRLAETAEQARSHLAEARARGDRVATFMHTVRIVWALLAEDHPEQAHRLVERRLLPRGEPVFQDQLWMQNRYYVACYRRCARQLWYDDELERKRLLSSFYLRLLYPGVIAAYASGLAAQAAAEAPGEAERRRLRSTALRLAKQSARSMPAHHARHFAPPAALVAYLRGDREGAIAALRAHLALGPMRLCEQLTRRKLGELLQDAEGEALIASADEALRSGGVVDPARFASALYAGIELP